MNGCNDVMMMINKLIKYKCMHNHMDFTHSTPKRPKGSPKLLKLQGKWKHKTLIVTQMYLI